MFTLVAYARKRRGAAGRAAMYEAVRLCAFPFITNYVIDIIIDFNVIIVRTSCRRGEDTGTEVCKHVIANNTINIYIYAVPRNVIKGFYHGVVRLSSTHVALLEPCPARHPPASTFQRYLHGFNPFGGTLNEKDQFRLFEFIVLGEKNFQPFFILKNKFWFFATI